MYLLNDSGSLAFIEDGQDGSSGRFELGFNAEHLEGCTEGAVAIGGKDWALYHPYNGEIEPIELETNWTGDVNTLSKFSFADIVFVDTGNRNIDLSLFLFVRGEKLVEEKVLPVSIRAKDWKSDLLRVRVSSKESIGSAFKLRIKTTDSVSLMSMAVCFERASEYTGDVLFVGGVK